MNSSRTKKNIYRVGQTLLLIALLGCMVFALVSTHQLNQSIDRGNRKIVLNYGNQVAARLHDLFERIDISLAALANNTEARQITDMDMDMLSAELEKYREIWSMDAVGILHEDGTSSLADGSEVIFENEISLQDVLTYSQQLNISRQNIEGQDMLVFAKPCQMQVDGTSVSGVFTAMNLGRLEELLGDYGYSSDSFLVLTQSNGDNIWKQTNDQPGNESNCFQELGERSIEKGDSILQMQTRMNVAMDGTIAYSDGGQSYYMAYVPLGVNYWYLLVSAQSDSIDLTELSRQHFIISSILVGVVLLMGAISIVYLFQRNRSMSRYNEQLQVANKANQANRAKQEFLAKVSHDIRTPLNGVMGMLTLAKEEYSDKAKCLEYLDKASVSARYLLELLNDVLDMSQIESGKQRLVEETVDINEMLREIEAILENSAGEKGLAFQMDLDEVKHQYFKGDSLRIKQILMNLSSNAVKYTSAGGWIRLKVEEVQQQEGTQLVFKVQDSGEGIAEDKLESIFKPFEQVSLTRQGGVGLGLSIVHSYVELMKGKVTVESQLGVGSTFTVTLPLQVVEPPQIKALDDQNTNLQGISVLLAEDNEINAEIAIFMLEKHGAFVKHVPDGEEAVEEFKQNTPGTYQVILMDIQMPKMNGLEATKAIRELDRPDAGSIPIISMTANAFHEQTEEMLQAGMDDFLYKPIDTELLCSCIRKWVKEG